MFLGSKQLNVATQFFIIRPASGFMGNFRFRRVYKISRQAIDQSKLRIAQIEAQDQIKIFLFCKFGVGVTWGQNPNIFIPRQIIYQNEALGPIIKKKMVFEVIRPEIKGICGHLRSKSKVVRNQTNKITRPRTRESGSFGVI